MIEPTNFFACCGVSFDGKTRCTANNRPETCRCERCWNLHGPNATPQYNVFTGKLLLKRDVRWHEKTQNLWIQFIARAHYAPAASKVIALRAQVFEDVRRSSDRLPADGDRLELDARIIAEIAECAWSTDAVKFAARHRKFAQDGGQITLCKLPAK